MYNDKSLVIKLRIKNEEISVGHLNFLEGAVDHGYEHVQQNDDHGNVVNSIEDVAGVFDELVPIIDNDRFHFRKSKYCPKQCFKAFFNSASEKKIHISTCFLNHLQYASLQYYSNFTSSLNIWYRIRYSTTQHF